jgi:histone H3/H4
MQPPHLSCPSSSQSALASSFVQKYVHSALSAAGFARSSGQAVELLTEVFERYLLLLGSSTQQNASHVGRTIPCAWDVEAALRSLGSSADDVQTWLNEDGFTLAGQYDLASTSRQLEDVEDAELDEGSRVLEERLRFAKRPRQEALKIFYEDVSAEQAASMEADDVNDGESEEDDGSHDLQSSASEAQTPPPPYPGPNMLKRTRSPSPDSIYPSFLPAWPTGESKSQIHVVNDAEYAQNRLARATRPGLKSELTSSSDADLIKAAHIPPEPADAPSRPTKDLWTNAVSFQDSSLAAIHGPDDFPALDERALAAPSSVATHDNLASSMRAFANDYPALVMEARGSELALLTPTGSQHARAFHQRRALAAFLADPSKYVPCDTIFGGVSARPTALPFQPTASMLITPPTAEHSAPTFTPLRPNGRELPSSTSQSHALYPACRHRIPGNVLNAARLVSGGVATETYRRMTRIHDPDPILDEHHAERVFHGQAAPKELLTEGNSVLKGALDALKVKRAEERAAAREEMGLGEYGAGESGELDENGKPTGQLSMSATRDRIKVKNGTIVSTWDWMSRDFTDPVLPGKKFKAGTMGITLSGSADTGTPDDSMNRPHQRSASVVLDPGSRQRERSASRPR